ncbi:MAG: DNA cytosine methyltransferase, partial [Allomuricauda sp.]
MPKAQKIPVVDLFAGPGGLAEGFSSIFDEKRRVFDIRLSIEKDSNAHKTLELRSFYRQFPIGKAPDEYYDLLKETNLKKRDALREALFEKYVDEAKNARKEAWRAELGAEEFPNDLVDKRITKALNGEKKWVLIGGPPCQAYSLVGRSRVGGIDEEDHRVYLYQEYLRIIAKHHPTVFVMENVKGLLSAKLEDEKIFPKILEDLKNPGLIFSDLNSPDYNIYSLVKDEIKNDRDYLIKSEDFGIPQKRHRVILLGIRKDIKKKPKTLVKSESKTTLKSVIGKLPKIRSGLNRRFVRSIVINKESGKKKRYYENVLDSPEEWEKIVNGFKNEIESLNGIDIKDLPLKIKAPKIGLGSEFVKCKNTIDENHSLKKWYIDEKLKGVPNHQSRSHLVQDLKRYLFASTFSKKYKNFPRMNDYREYSDELLPDHENANSGKFTDRFRVQLPNTPATTVTSHISKDGHY